MFNDGQLVVGTVSRVAKFRAFVCLEPGIEALLHGSQLADPAPVDPSLLVHEGQRLLLRVISIEPDRQRLGLSLKEVTQEERERWQEREGIAAPVVAEPVAEDQGSVEAADPVQS